MRWKKSPSIKNSLKMLKESFEGLGDKLEVVIVGKCGVIYRGRANSGLGMGERVIIIKGDIPFQIDINLLVEHTIRRDNFF